MDQGYKMLLSPIMWAHSKVGIWCLNQVDYKILISNNLYVHKIFSIVPYKQEECGVGKASGEERTTKNAEKAPGKDGQS